MKFEEDLNSLIKSSGETEAVTECLKIKNKEEVECENHFVKTHQRDIESRYVVTLPLRQDVHLGDSSLLATQRLNNLWKRLDKTPDMSRMYCEFMSEYEPLGHMQKLQSVSETLKCIMPHYGVYKAESSTIKLQVVFDASAPSSGVSLNDRLMNGGVVQDDMFSILLRFRKHKVLLLLIYVKYIGRFVQILTTQTSVHPLGNTLNDASKLNYLA
ncbi:uncharacterized protein LOC118188865 [Stegodyphus dumicola]|uniref:uncharacterized protein LOC118188865 n=1 Tax=Stegodyphus dumicola TaxID=202533 RepID=UPI0015AD107D|nr:uncharacterized protein LOC118188865 [Stegodyphus dumicola]